MTTEEKREASRANVVYRGDPVDWLERSEPSPNLHIRVDWDRRVPEVRFVPVNAGQQMEGWTSEGPGYQEALKFAQYLETHLGKIAPGFRRPSAWPSVRHRLKALGWRAADRILPVKLIEYVNDNLDPGNTLTISTNECWIPWELVFDLKRNEFWGEMFVLNRRQTRDVRPQLPPRMTQPHPSLRKGKRVVSVVGDRTGSARLAPSLWKKFLPDLESLESNEPTRSQFFTVARVVAAIESGAEIIHLTCHGEVDHAGERYLRLGPHASEHFLYAFDVLPVDIGEGLLFLNACSAVAPHDAGLGPWLGLTTFGWLVELRRKGAVIGTYAPISAVAANEVATRFYQHFLVDNLTAGESLYRTKQSLKLENKPFGLVYSLYGDANLKLSPASPSAELQ
ncbi:MAG TPA: CHAT domain-containing protein [Longimicrobium sp.]|nr:CHAT domain-containing protein [Longimicrobium sp.]